MTEELLDRSEVRTPLQEVGGERMTKRMGRHAAMLGELPHPELEPSAHVRGREAAAVPREKQRLRPRLARQRSAAPSPGSAEAPSAPARRSAPAASSEPLPTTRRLSDSKSIESVSRFTISSARRPHEYASSNIARSRASSGVFTGIRSRSSATSSRPSVRGRRCSRFGVGRSSAGLGRPCPRPPDSRGRSAPPRACARRWTSSSPRLREPRREAAQVAVAELTGLGAARGRPLGQFRTDPTRTPASSKRTRRGGPAHARTRGGRPPSGGSASSPPRPHSQSRFPYWRQSFRPRSPLPTHATRSAAKCAS